MITWAQNAFEKAYGAIFNTTAAESKTVRHETDERVCDTGAILSDQQEAVGVVDGKMGARDWASLPSLSPLSFSLSLPLSVLVASGHKG